MTFSPPAAPDAEPSIPKLALSWIDHDVRARLIVDHRLRVVWANAAARVALAKRRDVEARGGILSATQPSAHSALVDFILDSGAAVSCCCVRRTDGDGHLLFRCQRISWEGYGLFGLSFLASGNDFQARYADLDTAFRLTRSEHEVLTELLDGQDADRIALNRGVSLETVRSQVRQIYGKLQVKTREGLFRKALPFLL